jgi:hypothetical protein
MSCSFIRRRSLIALGCCLGAAAAWSAGVPSDQASRARAVIQAQLDAFAADDSQRAFLLGTEALRKRFGSPDRFMSMIRRGYPVVYRPATVAFLQPQWDAARLIQAVQMTDAQGNGWLATYRLERQGTGPWLIAACEVVPNEGSFT